MRRTNRFIPTLISVMVLGCCVAVAQQPTPPPPGQEQSSTIKVNVRLVNVFATVTDKSGAPVADLTEGRFQVEEDGVPQKIAIFEKQSERPLRIILALDASASVHKDLKLELDSAHRFVAALMRPVDHLSLLRFTENVDQVMPFTNDLKRIENNIKGIRTGAGTALYDAIYLGSQMLSKYDDRKVMVLITDGGDTFSQTTYQEAVRAAQISEATVYSIILVPIEASAGRNTGGEHALIQLSQDTGGKYYYASSPAELDVAFQQISRELRTQYLIGYYSSQKSSSSEFRKISINVTKQPTNDAPPPLYRVRNRAGYYTSKLE